MLKVNEKCNYQVGVDIGTTNLKAILFDQNLKVIKAVSKHYPTFYDDRSFAEQDIDDIYKAFVETVNELTLKAIELNAEISHISFSSAMHSLILADDNMLPLTKNIIWTDNRAKDEISKFKEENDWLKFYKKTGTPIHPMSPFAKLLWFKNNDLLSNVRYIFGIKEYILFKITGKYVMDYSLASSTGLLNILELKWDSFIIDFLGLSENNLPKLVDVDYQMIIESSDFLTKTSLTKNTKIVIGASDGCLINLGASALESGKTTLTIGTSGAIRMTVDKPTLDSKGRTFCYYLSKDKWVIGGAVNNGGNVVEWLGKLLFKDSKELFNNIPSIIKNISSGSDGLCFVPYLYGERAPFWDANLFASFINISPIHTKEHFIKATLEGVIINLKNVWLILQDISGASSEVFVTGGLLSNENILPLVSNIFGKEITFQKNIEHTCLGAVMLSHNDCYDRDIEKTIKFYPVEYEVSNYQKIQAKFNSIVEQVIKINA